MAILDQVQELMDSEVAGIIDSKATEFRNIGKGSAEKLFGELCFCILTANTSAEMGIRTQNLIGIDGFLNHDRTKLRDELKRTKYRFYNLRAGFITEARWIADELPSLVGGKDREHAREYLVENVKGIGFKEASHFLRNVGVFDFAILDKHIMKMLSSEYGFPLPKSVSRKNYLENEERVVDLASRVNLEPGIFDLYMWKIATGKIIK